MDARLALVLLFALAVRAADFRGVQFIGFDKFDTFDRSEQMLLSPKITARIPWDELVASWNFRGVKTDGLRIEVKVFHPGRDPEGATGWYCLGKWALDPSDHPRESVKEQKNHAAKVDTDILKLREPAEQFQVRIAFSKNADPGALNFLGFTLAATSAEQEAEAPNQTSWGKIIPVPERSQMNYPEGVSEWCSPTAMTMLLSFWATSLNRPDLNYEVPEVARGVHDPNWPGTGNWPFNTAFAGWHPGIRAYVARFSEISELEDWIEAGIPVAVSVRYGLLKGEVEPGNGHLVVCIGFDRHGDIIVNDPGRSQVRQTYQRDNFIRAWKQSRNTVYLVYPESHRLPRDRFGHWFAPNRE